ncbi:alpha-N-acetylglucosaminidase-like isoform X3 [Homarus americanus]|uniref:alpha-N-acetylglucosaminidase-like isoform X3 n=1 Tax=Homarus americanus TaxID=6706 RepID=UPI001C439020|nr:alpha-N-acetylglucosaminidase-like isoform X3 [Homarus americanus]
MEGTKKCQIISRSWIQPMLLLVVIALVLVGEVAGNVLEDPQPWERYLRDIKSQTSPEDQAEAVGELLKRLLPERAKDFVVRVDPSIGPEGRDTFMVNSPGVNGSVDVAGTSGVAAAWGILHYLKYYCNAHVSWEADQLDLPETLPSAQFNVTSNDRFRYYQNVCTVSYSMVWWGWQRWQREIDWMALNGINLPLAFTGQEAIWHRVYTKMGITQAELDEHFAGPAFLAWGRMGNIRGWGGPLTPSWHNQTLALQKQIVTRMRLFGMFPVLPAFAGHVPAGLTRIHPDANITRLDAWSHFTDPYTRTYLLDPNDPLFQTIGSAFIQEMTSVLGSDHFYNCDTFNEMTPTSSDPDYLKSVGAAIYEAMTKVDHNAIWVMQGWLFFSAESFWQKAQAQALLTSVPIGRLLVLDLASEIAPQYNRLESYFGQPFIFCMLLDYGGVNGLFGNVDVLLKNMEDARKFPNVTLVGTGLTPEGINQNYVMYDFMNELGWRSTSPNVSSWAIDYARRRYGSDDPRLGRAWQLLMRSVYNCTTYIRYHGKGVIIMHRPRLHPKQLIWYSVVDVITAWDLLINVAKGENNAEIFAEDIAESKQSISKPNTETEDSYGDHNAVLDRSFPQEQPSLNIGSQEFYLDKIKQDFSNNKNGEIRQMNHRNTQELQHNRVRRSGFVSNTADRMEYTDKASALSQIGKNSLNSFHPRFETSMGKEDEISEANMDRKLIRDGISASTESNKRTGKYGPQENESEMDVEMELESNSDPRKNGLEARNKSVTNQATFQHDLVDVTRQILQLVGGQMVLRLVQNYNNNVLLALQESHILLQELLVDLDLLLGTSPDFLLGRWVDASASWATSEKERDHYIFNALNQITLWGPTGEIHDYAIKQWSGLVLNYIKPRWEFFSQTLLTSLEQGLPFDEDRFRWDLFTLVEDPFTKDTNISYPSQPQGDPIQTAINFHTKYRPIFDSRFLHILERRYQSSLGQLAKMKMMKKEVKGTE